MKSAFIGKSLAEPMTPTLLITNDFHEFQQADLLTHNNSQGNSDLKQSFEKDTFWCGNLFSLLPTATQGLREHIINAGYDFPISLAHRRC